MLAHFSVKKHYCGIDASIYVDCDAKEAHLMIKRDRTITRMEQIPYWETNDPTKADRWLSRPIGQYPSVMEYLHAYRGLGASL